MPKMLDATSILYLLCSTVLLFYSTYLRYPIYYTPSSMSLRSSSFLEQLDEEYKYSLAELEAEYARRKAELQLIALDADFRQRKASLQKEMVRRRSTGLADPQVSCSSSSSPTPSFTSPSNNRDNATSPVRSSSHVPSIQPSFASHMANLHSTTMHNPLESDSVAALSSSPNNFERRSVNIEGSPGREPHLSVTHMRSVANESQNGHSPTDIAVAEASATVAEPDQSGPSTNIRDSWSVGMSLWEREAYELSESAIAMHREAKLADLDKLRLKVNRIAACHDRMLANGEVCARG